MVDQTLQVYPLFSLFSSTTFTFSTIVPKTESLERLFLKRGGGKGGQGVAGGFLRAVREKIHRKVFPNKSWKHGCPPLPPLATHYREQNTHRRVNPFSQQRFHWESSNGS